ncbi:hypothetical protein HYV69_00465 [Candidatus Uhrbacteria bacterium]|nr:hypothetical protein [Candidatus Uhrbacteria bacterium]
MRRNKSTTIYRSLLRDAFSVTWHRRSLWIFGIFAGVISTGGVIDVAISGIRKATATGSLLTNMLDRTFIGYAYASEFILRLIQIDSKQVTLFITLGIVAIIALVACGVISQAALIHAAGNPYKHPCEIRKHVFVFFWDIFLVNLITKVAYSLLITLLTLPVILFIQNNSAFASTILFIHFFIFIPAVIILHIISLLALVDVVENKSNALNAFHTALHIFRKQWLATIEFGAILFAILFVAIIVLLSVFILISIPFAYINTVILIIGSPILFLIMNSITGILMIAVILTFGGALVTFQYSAWKFFFKRATHHIFGDKVFSKLWRMVA